MPRPIGIPHHRESNTIWQAIGAVVTEIRIKKGLSQEALAAKLGCGVSYISKLERGRMNPTLTRLFDLTDSLDVKIGVFISRVRRKFEGSIARVSQAKERPSGHG